jgi:hypothetical protein
MKNKTRINEKVIEMGLIFVMMMIMIVTALTLGCACK